MSTNAKKLVFFLAAAGIASFAGHASAATLSFSPASANHGTGDSFAVQVQVDSQGAAINSSDGEVKFDPTLLTVSSVDQTGSIFSLWTSQPTFSNTAGTVDFSGGTPTPYSGSGGTIITIHFKAAAAGTANVGWNSGEVLAADGQGTNVLSTSGTGTYTIGGASAPTAPAQPTNTAPAADTSAAYTPPAPPIAVTITSPTHPDPNQWYSNNNPELDWKNPPDIEGVDFSFNKKSSSDPGKVSQGLLATKTYTAVDDGTWYFHIRFQDQSGYWSQIVNRQVLVDKTPPLPFTVTLDPTTPINSLPRLLFKTTDDTSGIDHYEVTFDDSAPINVDPQTVVSGPYTVPALLPGSHKVLVTAKDRAGNGTQATYSFSIDGIPMATITDIPVNVNQGEPIVVSGIANPGSTVLVTIKKGASTVAAQGSAQTWQDGKWIVYFKNGLGPGDYDVTVAMITQQGAKSPTSDPITLHVAWPFIEIFGWSIIALLLALVGALVYLWYKERHIFLLRHIDLKNRIEDLRKKNKLVFDTLHDEIDEEISFMDSHVAEKSGMEKLEPVDVATKLKEAVDVTQETINKGVGDIETAFVNKDKDKK